MRLEKGRERVMGKVVCCNWVHPAGCDLEIRGDTVEEVLEQAMTHALEHGIEPTQELLGMVVAAIEDE
jgi:predicted small metal-binding protein